MCLAMWEKLCGPYHRFEPLWVRASCASARPAPIMRYTVVSWLQDELYEWKEVAYHLKSGGECFIHAIAWRHDQTPGPTEAECRG